MWGTNGFFGCWQFTYVREQLLFGCRQFKLKRSVGRSLLLRMWGSNGFWSLIVQTETNSTEKKYLSITKTVAVECVSFFFEVSCMRSCLETRLHKARFFFLIYFIFHNLHLSEPLAVSYLIILGPFQLCISKLCTFLIKKRWIVVTFILEANMQQYHQGFALISLFRDAAVAIKTHTSQIKHITVYVALNFVFPATNCFWLFAYMCTCFGIKKIEFMSNSEMLITLPEQLFIWFPLIWSDSCVGANKVFYDAFTLDRRSLFYNIIVSPYKFCQKSIVPWQGD